MDTRSRIGSTQHRRSMIVAWVASICLVNLLTHTERVSAADDDASLRRILASVANTPLANAPFIALKSSGLLAAPVESRGTLTFSANGPIEKHITSPIDERTTITVEAVRIERAGRETDEVSFAKNPALTAYAQGLRAILGGNTAPLHEHFTLTLDGDVQQWRLTLRPKSVRLQSALSILEVTGANGLIGTIMTVEASGDVDTLTILLSAS